MKPVITNDGNNSYFDQVGNSVTPNVKQYNPQRPITKNGYVYIYVSNETPNIYTYWDNLQVTHIHGHLLQEEGYYPFGLEMKAINSAAAMKQQTRHKFNAGTALEESFDVDYYEIFFREYDAQIGRFTSVDAMSAKTIAQSPYQFAINNPISFNDPTGLQIDYKNTRGEFTNWNPQLKIGQGWLTNDWNNFFNENSNFYDPAYISQLLSITCGGGPGNASFDNYGNFFSSGQYATNTFSGFLDAYNHPDQNGNLVYNVGKSSDGRWGYWSTGPLSFGDFVNVTPIIVTGSIRNGQWHTSNINYGTYGSVYGFGLPISPIGTYKIGDHSSSTGNSIHWYNWNSNFMRKIVPDKISISAGINFIFGVGVGAEPINFFILTRGQQPGIYLTPTFHGFIGGGASLSGGISFAAGNYTGDPREISQAMLSGNSYGWMATGGFMDDISVGHSYSPTGNGNGFDSWSVGVGVGDGLFVGSDSQTTPGYGPLWQW